MTADPWRRARSPRETAPSLGFGAEDAGSLAVTKREGARPQAVPRSFAHVQQSEIFLAAEAAPGF